MKVVVGIDKSDQYVQALRLLARLRISNLNLLLVHVRPRPDEDDAVLTLRAEVFAQRLGLKASPIVEVGQPSERLECVAREERAELIAIGSNQSGPFYSALFGSVGRSLVNDWRGSLLVAKGEVAEEGPVRAVIGYEGTPACEKGITRLMNWNPHGMEHAELVTVEPVFTCELSDRQIDSYASTAIAVPTAAEKEAIRIRSAGWCASSRITYGEPLPQLREAMHATNSDLLILPSRYHSTIDRFVFGSTALAEVVGEHHSVLVIR
jgi:nucleotide-binding universal stress UspA family protein